MSDEPTGSKLLDLKRNITKYNLITAGEKRRLDVQLRSNPQYIIRNRKDIECRKRKYIEGRRHIITKARQYFDEKHGK